MGKRRSAKATPIFREIVMRDFRVGAVEIRRGTLFLVAIGGPLLAGVITGQPAVALSGPVVGMLLAFADDDGPIGCTPASSLSWFCSPTT
jgi:hypothetical protein